MQQILHRIVSVLILAALVSGCAHYEANPVLPRQTAEELESRSLDSAATKAFLEKCLQTNMAAWPLPEWDFEKLTLVAFYYHPDLDVARAAWGVAQAGIATAGGRINPTLSVSPAYNFSHVNAQPGLSPWLPTVSLDVPIETAGKRSKRIAQAQNVSEAARLDIIATAWDIRGKVRGSLLNIDAAQQRQLLLQKQIEAQEQVVQLMEKQVQAGAATPSEIVTFRIALQRARLDLADAQRQKTEARAQLAESLGLPLEALENIRISPVFGETNLAELTAKEARRNALLGRADILSALADYAAAESALRLEIARQYPDLHFGPNYNWNQGDNVWSLALSMELPILNRNQGPIAEAKAKRAQAAARFKALQAKVLAGIDSAVSSYHATETNLTMIKELAETQARARDAVAGQVQAGAASPLELLTAKLEYALAEIGLLEARIKQQQALAAIEDALQRPIGLITSAVAATSPESMQRKMP